MIALYGKTFSYVLKFECMAIIGRHIFVYREWTPFSVKLWQTYVVLYDDDNDINIMVSKRIAVT
jgi:hypothetical protein